MDNKTLIDIFNKAYKRFELKKLIKEELFKAINEDKEFITIGKGDDAHAIPVDWLKGKSKRYGGLSEQEFDERSREYREIWKGVKQTPQDIKKCQEFIKYLIEDAQYMAQDENINKPTRDYYAGLVEKYKKNKTELDEWFDLSKHQEKHMPDVWKKYLKEHPEEFKNGNKTLSLNENLNNIKPIKIQKNNIPQFQSKKELYNWVKGEFEKLGSVKIKDTGIELKLSASKANRETYKRRSLREENKAVFSAFEDIVKTSIKKEDREPDNRHNKGQEIYYNRFQIVNKEDVENYEVEIFVDKPASGDKNSYYAGHNATKIKITPRVTQVAKNSFNLHAKGATYIMTDIELNFNPNIK